MYFKMIYFLSFYYYNLLNFLYSVHIFIQSYFFNNNNINWRLYIIYKILHIILYIILYIIYKFNILLYYI